MSVINVCVCMCASGGGTGDEAACRFVYVFSIFLFFPFHSHPHSQHLHPHSKPPIDQFIKYTLTIQLIRFHDFWTKTSYGNFLNTRYQNLTLWHASLADHPPVLDWDTKHGPKVLLYDVCVDPQETRNLAFEGPERVAQVCVCVCWYVERKGRKLKETEATMHVLTQNLHIHILNQTTHTHTKPSTGRPPLPGNHRRHPRRPHPVRGRHHRPPPHR